MSRFWNVLFWSVIAAAFIGPGTVTTAASAGTSFGYSLLWALAFSTLACLLDAGVSRAFQYCGDRHPGLGLHDLRSNEPKICAWALAAWKQLLETPERLEATGSDQRGYNVVAGKSADQARSGLRCSRAFRSLRSR